MTWSHRERETGTRRFGEESARTSVEAQEPKTAIIGAHENGATLHATAGVGGMRSMGDALDRTDAHHLPAETAKLL